MTTKQVADRLIELCRNGLLEEAQDELYAEDIVSIEPEYAPQYASVNVIEKGLADVVAKRGWFNDLVDTFHGKIISEPIIAGDHFAVTWVMHATMKDGRRTVNEEVCVYKVKDGKIVLEQFFF